MQYVAGDCDLVRGSFGNPFSKVHTQEEERSGRSTELSRPGPFHGVVSSSLSI